MQLLQLAVLFALCSSKCSCRLNVPVYLPPSAPSVRRKEFWRVEPCGVPELSGRRTEGTDGLGDESSSLPGSVVFIRPVILALKQMIDRGQTVCILCDFMMEADSELLTFAWCVLMEPLQCFNQTICCSISWHEIKMEMLHRKFLDLF